MTDGVWAVQLQPPDGGWVDVGVLANHGERCWFESSPAYWELPGRPVLGQVHEERGHDWRPTARVALPTWFSHLLPQGELRAAIAAAARVNPTREIHLLAHIGQDDLPGAVRVVRTGDAPAGPPPLSASDSNELDPGGALKFSLAGVQLKFSLVERSGKGLTVPAKGAAGTVIAKLPDRRAGYGQVSAAELAGLELARAIGIPTPAAQLVPLEDIDGLPPWATTGGGAALAVQRFDRRGTDQRVHVEELAQVLSVPTGVERAKYWTNLETVASVTVGLCGHDAFIDVVDRIVLNVVLGNGDAHTKNWAYVYADGRTPALSPVYDIVPTVLFLPDDDLGLRLDGSTSFAAVTERSFDRAAGASGWEVGAARRLVVSAVERVVEAWPLLADHLSVADHARLTARRDGLALLNGR